MPIFAVDDLVEEVDDPSKPRKQQNIVRLRRGGLSVGLTEKFYDLIRETTEAQDKPLSMIQFECICLVVRAASWQGPDLDGVPVLLSTIEQWKADDEFVIRVLARAAELHAAAEKASDQLLEPIDPKPNRQTRRGKRSSSAGKTNSTVIRPASGAGTST